MMFLSRLPLRHFYISFLCVCLVMALNGCATTKPRSGAGTEVKMVNLKDLCDQFKADLNFDKATKVVTVEYKNKMIQGLVGSDEIIVNSEQVKILKPIMLRHKYIVVSEDFAQFFESKKEITEIPVGDYTLKKVKEVVIDAGHGGKDPGATGKNGVREKDVVLDIALRLKSLLENEGINVVMVRDKDEFISLKDRTEITSRRKADLFISIHANSHPKRVISGVEVYTMKDMTASERNEEQRKDNERILLRTLAVERSQDDVEETISKLLYERKQAEAKKLAGLIATKVTKDANAKNLGVKSSRFFVVRNTLIPAVLIETGFLSNLKEERLLASGYYRQKIAQGIAEAILLYMNE